MSKTKKNPHWGSTLDDFLDEDGIREAAKACRSLYSRESGGSGPHGRAANSNANRRDEATLMRPSPRWSATAFFCHGPKCGQLTQFQSVREGDTSP
jgi:hypothetical protein